MDQIHCSMSDSVWLMPSTMAKTDHQQHQWVCRSNDLQSSRVVGGNQVHYPATMSGEINDPGDARTPAHQSQHSNVKQGWYKVVEEESPTGFSIQGQTGGPRVLLWSRRQPSWSWTTRLSALVVHKYAI